MSHRGSRATLESAVSSRAITTQLDGLRSTESESDEIGDVSGRGNAPVNADSTSAFRISLGENVGTASLKTKFNALVEKWRRETEQLSDLQEVLEHPAYQQIINLGPSVVPLVLREH